MKRDRENTKIVVPKLETARLWLRGFTDDDLDALARIYAKPAVMEFIRNGTRTRQETQEELTDFQAMWYKRGYGVWALELKKGGTLAGLSGFVEKATLGYVLDEPFWGMGLATEAARACLNFGFGERGYERIGAGALETNRGSLHVIEKLGMHRTANAFFDLNGGAFFTITREEWQGQGRAEKARKKIRIQS